MLIVCTLTGYGHTYMTKNNGTEEAVRVVKSRISQYGRPLSLRVDSGPAFRDHFSDTMRKMGVKVQHSSAYSPQSNSKAKRFVHSTKNLLQKHGRMTQLELDEMNLCVTHKCSQKDRPQLMIVFSAS